MCSSGAISENERIRSAQGRDEELGSILEFFDKGITPEGHSALKLGQNFMIDEKCMLHVIKKSTRYEDDLMKIAVPKELQHEVLKQCHNDAFAGHKEIVITKARIQEKFGGQKCYQILRNM